jgi:hypothetical protein
MELVSELDGGFVDPICLFFFYKISCKDASITKCYIGKTTNLKGRMSNHKTKSKISELPLYIFMRLNGGFENFNFEVLHKCLCTDSTSIFIEHSLIKSYDDTFNIQTPYLGEKGYYNRDKCKEHYKTRLNCDCGWEGSKMNYSKHIKTSKKHRDFCIDKFEKQLECIMVVHNGSTSKEIVCVEK